jgi:hypothetical protein
MLTRELETKESSNKFFALQDRRMRNYANKTLFTTPQQIRLDRIKLALELIVKGTVYEPAYGKKSGSVKVQDGAIITDKKMLALLEADWEKEGIYKKVSAQGFQYHVPRI